MIHVCAAIGYAPGAGDQPVKNVPSALTSMPWAAIVVASVVGATNSPLEFCTLANVKPASVASLRSTYPIAPGVDEMIWATPGLPSPACVPSGHSTSEP